MGKQKYFTEEELNEAQRLKCKKWRNKNKEHISKYSKEYAKTKMGRASSLVNAYNNADKKANRDKGNLTAQWVIENIFSKPCVHCGETDWHKLGCNRLDNSKPHTIDNVEACCGHCNYVLSGRPKKRVLQIDVDTNEVIHRYESVSEAAKAFEISNATMSRCCNGEYKQYKGYIWKFEI